jgi:hypothetical protein
MDKHDSTLRYRVSCWVEVDPTLTVTGRKAFVAMVNIDRSDGRWTMLAMAVCQAASMVNVMASSRAGSRPQV